MENLYIFILVLGVLAGVHGAYRNFICNTNKSPELDFCARDCMVNHGRSGGSCGDTKLGDFNCYCNNIPTTAEHDQDPERQAKILNCKVITDGTRNVCTLDCICVHGAIGGYCDAKKQACICVGSGENKKNLFCPAKNLREYTNLTYNFMGPEILGEYGMAFERTWISKLDINGNVADDKKEGIY